MEGLLVKSCWSIAELLLGPQMAKSSRGKVGIYGLIVTNSVHSTRYTSTPAYFPNPPSDFSKGLALSQGNHSTE